jgi:hypothetical protein
MDNGEDVEETRAAKMDGSVIWEDKGEMAREPDKFVRTGELYGIIEERARLEGRVCLSLSFLRGIPRALRPAH